MWGSSAREPLRMESNLEPPAGQRNFSSDDDHSTADIELDLSMEEPMRQVSNDDAFGNDDSFGEGTPHVRAVAGVAET